MRRLVVLLPVSSASASAECLWVCAADGGSGRAPLDQLPPAAELVVVAPAARLSFHRVQLPRGIGPGSPRLRPVLEGLLEDRLLDEPSALLFALAPDARAGETVWVGVCEREWLRGHLAVLDGMGRSVLRIVPELAPGEPTRAWFTGDADEAELLLASGDGVLRWPLDDSAPALPESLRAQAGQARIAAEPAAVTLAERMLGRSVPVSPASDRLLQAADGDWDLAQFELARRGRALLAKRVRETWALLAMSPAWRPARWGLALLLLVQLAGINAWAWKERAALDGKRQALRTMLTQTFPQVQVVVDAPVQMAREVGLLRQATGAAAGHDLEPLLAAAAAALPAGQVPSSLGFTPGELRLGGLSPAPGDTEAWAESVRARGVALRFEAGELILTASGVR